MFYENLKSDYNFQIDPLKTERSEPIGAERDDDRNSDIMSLEQIITSPNRTFSTRSESLTVNDSEAIKKLNAKFEHANSMLHETEAANARLTEQTGLLKNEIRRLEKNQERQFWAPNYHINFNNRNLNLHTIGISSCKSCQLDYSKLPAGFFGFL